MPPNPPQLEQEFRRAQERHFAGDFAGDVLGEVAQRKQRTAQLILLQRK
jgi:hypothetical protein